MGAPAGPTGVIVLKKIADNTYEQYGQITLSSGALTQVTTSQAILQAITRTSLEDKQVWFEDFFSRLSQSQNNELSKGWPSGSWQSNGNQNEALTREPTVSGAVALTSTSTSVAGGLWAQLDPNSGGLTASDGRTNTNVDRLGTYYMRWAQTNDAGPATRSLGWQGVTGSRMDTTLHGIFMKHEFDQHIVGVCRSSNLETTVSSGVNASNGVYHNGKMVVNSTGAGYALIIGEYTGDGAADRSLDVSNYLPNCVWVFGRDSSNKMIGAFKILGMAANVCHPWLVNPATNAASRTNRINTLTSTGFTIKSDINVLNDHYMYVVFPPAPGFSEVGSYTGNGWSREGNVIMNTTTPGLFHINVGSQFLASDVGQTVIRATDSVVIGTITSVTNNANALGTTLLNNSYAGGTWRFLPRQIPLSFSPDFAMLCCTEKAGIIPPLPVQFGPGAGLSDDRDNTTGTTTGFSTTTITPPNATIQTNSSTMEVANDDSSGSSGMNMSNKEYFWFAFKTGSENIKFAKIDYTGDNSVPRTISAGVDFQPGFFMGFGKFDEPKWKATPSNVPLGTQDYAFNDGNILVNDDVTFAGNATVRLGAGDLNVLNRKYRVYVATGSAQPGASSVDFYLDNTLFGTITTNVPTADLKPSMSTATTSGIGMNVDYMGLIQNREAS